MLKLRKYITSFLGIMLALSLAVTPTVSALELTISGNGSESDNTISTQVEAETTVVQENNASVENDVNIDSNTGENEANDNSGEIGIETGDTTTEVEVGNELNSSAAEVECCGGDQTLEIVGNGSDSDNTINAAIVNDATIVSTQNAKVENNISGTSNTGNNTANDNGGDVSMNTGDIVVSGKTTTIANSSSINATVGIGGNLSAKIANNLAGSDNNISVKLVSAIEVVTEYSADIGNDIEWDLNTGGNTANDNLGDVSFLTGDIFFDFAITNGPINIGGVDIDCCGIYDPGYPGDGGNGGDDDGGDDDGSGDNGSSGNGNGDSSDDGGDSGTLLAAAAATELLGLSDTSSEEQKNRAFWIGLALMALGIKLLGDELQRYNKLSSAKVYDK